MSEKLLVPDIGDFENVEVIELLVKEGQEISKNDPVVTIGSFLLISSPSLTRSSITSTFSNSPMSGTNNFSVICICFIHHKGLVNCKF